jgi:two-component sensor histidine kinase
LLYQSRSFSKLEFSQTLSLLVENISNTLQTNAAVEVEIDCENLHLNINQAIPASLIVNEVLTNAYKHAFKEKKAGHIYFQLSENDDHIHIQIADDGVGLPNSEAYRKGSLGFQLIEVLCQQIHATYTYQNAEQGTVFNMEFQRLANARGIGNASLV